MKMLLVALLLTPTVTLASANSALPETAAVFRCKPQPSDNCAEQFKEGDIVADIKGGGKLVLRTVTPSSEEGKPAVTVDLVDANGVVLQTEELPANIGHIGRFLLEDKWYLRVQNITAPGSKKGLVMLMLRVELRPCVFAVETRRLLRLKPSSGQRRQTLGMPCHNFNTSVFGSGWNKTGTAGGGDSESRPTQLTTRFLRA